MTRSGGDPEPGHEAEDGAERAVGGVVGAERGEKYQVKSAEAITVTRVARTGARGDPAPEGLAGMGPTIERRQTRQIRTANQEQYADDARCPLRGTRRAPTKSEDGSVLTTYERNHRLNTEAMVTSGEGQRSERSATGSCASRLRHTPCSPLRTSPSCPNSPSRTRRQRRSKEGVPTSSTLFGQTLKLLAHSSSPHPE